MNGKDILRSALISLRLDLTKNLQYDRLTKKIMKRVIGRNTHCIDVGCHKGEMLKQILTLAPEGRHFAFEPIPVYYEQLHKSYGHLASVLPYALSDRTGESAFQFVKNAPAYSGLKRRRYDTPDPEIEEITVQLRRLDDVIPGSVDIGFIKIDVEGGEFDVLKGAGNLLKRGSPVVIFECGTGASEYYGTDPKDLFTFLAAETGLRLFTLKAFLENNPPLTLHDFTRCFETNSEYYFVAGR